jgi:predicted small lipoprotein YifL
MARTLITVATAAAALVSLAGCYTPRFPSESPSAASQESAHRDTQQQNATRDRRDSAVGSGSSAPR